MPWNSGTVQWMCPQILPAVNQQRRCPTVPSRSHGEPKLNFLARIDKTISINCAGRDHIENGNGLAVLSSSVNSADPLFNPHRIPWQIIVNDAIAELVIQLLAAYFGKEQNIKCFRVTPIELETAADVYSIFVRYVAVYQPNTKAILLQVVQQVTKRVPEAAEQHDTVVRQFLLFRDDAPERLQFGGSDRFQLLGLIQHLPNLVLKPAVDWERSWLCAGI